MSTISIAAQIFRGIALCFIAVGGTLANTLSLSYFITKADRSLGTKLLILLSILDLGVCLTAVSVPFLPYDDGDYVVTYAVIAVNILFVEATGFTTFLLSATRTIRLCRPFYRINQTVVFVLFGIYTGYVMVREGLRVASSILYDESSIAQVYYINYFFMLVLGGLVIILAVIISNTITVMELLKDGQHDVSSTANKRATVTVIILSLLYCSFNTVSLVIIGGYTILDWEVSDFVVDTNFMTVPLNSGLNPVVYFCRKWEMREYVRGVWRRSVVCRNRVVTPTIAMLNLNETVS